MKKKNTNVRPASQGPRLTADCAEFFSSLSKSLFDSYRPELHYMRGPGPKWHEKHNPAPAQFEHVNTLLPARAKA
ncbi:MAG: hypothetical protein ACJ8F3_17490 [Xanthobacteraceae bacterium]